MAGVRGQSRALCVQWQGKGCSPFLGSCCAWNGKSKSQCEWDCNTLEPLRGGLGGVPGSHCYGHGGLAPHSAWPSQLLGINLQKLVGSAIHHGCLSVPRAAGRGAVFCPLTPNPSQGQQTEKGLPFSQGHGAAARSRKDRNLARRNVSLRVCVCVCAHACTCVCLCSFMSSMMLS